MAAYVYVNIEVTDPVGYEEYRRDVLATIEAFGGKFLVRGGAFEILEGEADISRIIILEFPNMERLKAWYDSEEYKPLIALRKRVSTALLVAIEGA